MQLLHLSSLCNYRILEMQLPIVRQPQSEFARCHSTSHCIVESHRAGTREERALGRARSPATYGQGMHQESGREHATATPDGQLLSIHPGAWLLLRVIKDTVKEPTEWSRLIALSPRARAREREREERQLLWAEKARR